MEEESKLKGAGENCSEISIRQFLDFLKTAYQVQDSLEGVLTEGGMTEAVDWLKLKQNELVKPKEDLPESKSSSQDEKKELFRKRSDSTTSTSTSCDSKDQIKRKLSQVLSEGLLDSVLPYLVPSALQSRKSSLCKIQSNNSLELKSVIQSVTSVNSLKKRNSLVSNSTSKSSQGSKSEICSVEVEIHVCDEVKQTKKDFTCNQKLLVEKMGYFAEVTSGQKLEDMDISVHCDIGIFDWLMRWVKKESVLEDDWPQLDPQCVIPILVSAAFLQMEPLQNDCLLYCHRHMNEILRTSTNLSCLNDSILTRLAAMYTNSEVEAIKDRKDKIQSRIYTKLIHSLAECEPESVRGHWCSLSRVFRCGKCLQLVAPAVGRKIPCLPTCMQLQSDGSIVSHHLRDSSWNINDYIVNLQKTLKTWRKVYWRLWGDAHFLYCTTCKRFFPSRQVGWCRFHPDPPQYFTLDTQKAPLPVGRYPCCGERAYRFQLLPEYSGCQFREHTICTKDIRDGAVLSLLESFRSLIEEEPPQLMFPERLTRLVARDSNVGDATRLACKEVFWWEGFQIIPPRPKLGLLSNFATRKTNVVAQPAPPPPEESSEEPSSSTDSSTSSSSSDSSSSSEDSGDNAVVPTTAHQNPPTKKKTPRRNNRRRIKKEGRLWQHNLSARSNQDIQRAYEETAIKEMTAVLNRRTCQNSVEQPARSTVKKSGPPLGGLWVRLESEWRENNNIPGGAQTKVRSIFTGKNRTRNMRL